MLRTRTSRSRGLILALALTASIPALSACGPEPAAEEVVAIVATERPLIGGGSVRLFGVEDRRVQVLVFTTVDCPIARGYAPELARIAGSFPASEVVVRLVVADPRLDAETAMRQRVEDGHDFPMIDDREHRLVRMLGAEVTPQAFVLAPPRDGETWRVLYSGRIDDLYVDFGKRRARATRRDLREAIARALAGEDRRRIDTRAIGCPIPGRDGS